jgi:hypothetical protein
MKDEITLWKRGVAHPIQNPKSKIQNPKSKIGGLAAD